MLRNDAQALVAALRTELARGADPWTRRCAESVQALHAEAAPDGEWTVVLHWAQGPFEHGLRIRDLTTHLPAGTGTVQEAATEIRISEIEEPHGPRGTPDPSGRYWLSDS